MKTSQTSITAQGIALIRALEYERPETERICSDPLAGKFIDPVFYRFGKMFAGFAERRSPGVMGFMTARCRYMDDCLTENLAAGIGQLVLLGAGLDSRAYRFEELRSGIRVFEVDHPATQRAKTEKVKRVLGSLPGHVTYIPIDFNSEDLRKMLSAGYDPTQKTLFIWEGVTPYLTADAVDQTLKFVTDYSAPESAIVFDYIYSSALTSKEKRAEITRMQRSSRFTGEGLTFGIAEGAIEEFLRARGFGRIVNMTADDLHRRYFTGVNKKRTVASIYAIAHGAVVRKVPRSADSIPRIPPP